MKTVSHTRVNMLEKPRVQLFKKSGFLLIILFILCQSANAQEKLKGTWKGDIDIFGSQIKIELIIKDSATAEMNIPQQNAYGLKVNNLNIHLPEISFEILQAPRTASFNGNIKKDTISGKYLQLGYKGIFKLIKQKNIAKGNSGLVNAPHFIAKDVTFYDGNIKLAGTLTVPDSIGKFPAVVLLTGSGKQNRNENIFGFKIFKIIADYLTNHQIAVLRFDDRGIGGSSASATPMTTADYAKDALAAINFLQKQKNILYNKIGLLGHSTGGLAGMIAASESDKVAFLVTMAGPAIPGRDIVLYQIKTLMKAKGFSKEKINEALKLQKKVNYIIKNNKNPETLKKDIVREVLQDLKTLPPEKRAQIKNDSAYAVSIAQQKIQTLKNPWIKYFFNYNPADAIEHIKCPVLALFGGLDMQVPVKLNEKPLITALEKAKNKNYKVVIFPDANHLFQKAKTGLPDEYSKLDKKFVSGFLSTIAVWIKKNEK